MVFGRYVGRAGWLLSSQFFLLLALVVGGRSSVQKTSGGGAVARMNLIHAGMARWS